MIFDFKALDNRLLIEKDAIIPSGCVKTPLFRLSLSPEWENYSITVQFIGAGKTVHIAGIIPGNAYTIPWECLTEAGCLSISLKGIGGNRVKTTLPATLSVRSSLITEGSEPQSPTPSAYEQYVTYVSEMLFSTYDELEQKTNKLSSILGEHGDQEFPTAVAVKEYIDSLMFGSLQDEMAENRVSGIAIPSAVVDYVLGKTYSPTWHKQTVTLSDDLNGNLILSDYIEPVDCIGLKVISSMARGEADATLTAEVCNNPEFSGTPVLRLDGAKYISGANAMTYGKLDFIQSNGIWDLKWYTAEGSLDGGWSNCYGSKPRYAAVSAEECPYIRHIRIRSSSGVIPAGSKIDIWRLY